MVLFDSAFVCNEKVTEKGETSGRRITVLKT